MIDEMEEIQGEQTLVRDSSGLAASEERLSEKAIETAEKRNNQTHNSSQIFIGDNSIDIQKVQPVERRW